MIPEVEYNALRDLHNSTTGWLGFPTGNYYYPLGVGVTGVEYTRHDFPNGVFYYSDPVIAKGHVTTLDLSFFGITGTIPASLGNLTHLQVLDLSANSLSGNIPASLGNLVNLQGLDLGNNFLSGNIPASLGNLINLRRLSFFDNQLSGAIPASLGNLRNLQELFLNRNQLSGTIPGILGNLANLQELFLNRNQLSGAIPTSLGNLANIHWLDLGYNHLSGIVPVFYRASTTQGKEIRVLGNYFADSFTPSASCSNLQQTLAAGNHTDFYCVSPPVARTTALVLDLNLLRLNPSAMVTTAQDGRDTTIQISSNPRVLAAQSALGVGVLADGVAPVLIGITVALPMPTNVLVRLNFNITGGSLMSGLSRKLRVLSNGGWSAPGSTDTVLIPAGTTAAYAALDGIGADEITTSNPPDFLNVAVQAFAGSTIYATNSFQIGRPPVVLVHGFNDTGDSWSSGFVGRLSESRPGMVVPITYGATMSAAGQWDKTRNRDLSLVQCASDLDQVLQRQIESGNGYGAAIALGDWYFLRYDLVCHSQGGLLARLLCRAGTYEDPTASFGRRYPRGRFNRVITIGSPHNGSVLAYYAMQMVNAPFWRSLVPEIMKSQGLLQPKFNPFGPEIRSLNSVPVDPRIPFHMVATTVPNTAPAYGLLGLNAAKLAILAPFGSDGVVDWDSQVARPVNSAQFSYVNLVAHAPPESLFSVPTDSVDMRSAGVADEVNQLLGGAMAFFGSFSNPTSLPGSRQAEIDLLVPQNIFAYMVSRPPAGQAPRHKSVASMSVTNSYPFTLQPLVNEPLQGIVNWFAEVFGANGVVSSNVTVAVDAVDSTRATVLVPDSVVGDVVLYASYLSTNGKFIFANPVAVVTQSAGAAMTNLVVQPASATLRPGEQIHPELWGQFTNGTRQQLFVAPGSVITVSNTNPIAVMADTNLTVTAIAGGIASLGYQYQGFSNTLNVTVVQPLVVGLQPTNQSGTNGVTVSLSANVSGDGPIGYQWLKDGLVITNGNGISGVLTNALLLSNTARSHGGVYTLVASNAVGTVVSSNAVVRVRVPQRLAPVLPSAPSPTAFRLGFQDTDGGVLAASDVPNFEVQYTTNFNAPNTLWITNTSGFTISNGMILFDDSGSSNAVRRFYRVIEK